jgi:hypothetical protein
VENGSCPRFENGIAIELCCGRDRSSVPYRWQLPAFVYHIVAARFLSARGPGVLEPRAPSHVGGDVGGSESRIFFAFPMDNLEGDVKDWRPK